MLYTQRLFWLQFNTPEKLERILAFFQKHRTICHQISFFTESDGCDYRWVPPDEVARRAAWMKQVVTRARLAGFGVAINILQTMGHADDGGPDAPAVPWQGIMGPDGVTARQCSCPSDPDFLEYVQQKYHAFAQCNADCYWIDDDLRMHNHKPVMDGCYCLRCRKLFAQSIGSMFHEDRAAFVNTLAEQPAMQQQWRAFGQQLVLGVIRSAADGILSAHPNAAIGRMTCAADDHRADMDLLHELGAGEVWQRPGGGFWDESRPRQILGKTAMVGTSMASAKIGERYTYEVENYPYCIGAKSARITAIECLLQILAGKLDGIMFDLMDSVGNDPTLYDNWFERLADWQPHFHDAFNLVRDTIPVGWYAMQPPEELLCMGIPMTGLRDQAWGTILTGTVAAQLSSKQWDDCLTKPLIMDGAAAAIAMADGLGYRIGLQGIAEHRGNMAEVFTTHAINAHDQGYRRGFTMPYFNAVSHVLDPLPQTQVITEACNALTGQSVGASLTLFQPDSASPVAVVGHSPWQHSLTPPRMRQMRRMTQVMVPELDLVRIQTEAAIALWYRRNTGNTGDLMILCNPSQETVCVDVQSQSPCYKVIQTECSHAQSLDHGLRWTLPSWSIGVCRIEKVSVEL